MLCKLLAGCHLLTQIPGEMPHEGMRCGAGCLSHTKKEARRVWDVLVHLEITPGLPRLQ